MPNKKHTRFILSGCLALMMTLSACSSNSEENEVSETTTVTTADTIPTVDIQTEVTTETTTIITEDKPAFPTVFGKTPESANILASDIAHSIENLNTEQIAVAPENKSKTIIESVFTYNDSCKMLAGQYNCDWSTKITMPAVSNLRYKFIYKNPSSDSTTSNMIEIDPDTDYSLESLYDRWVLNDETMSSLYTADKNKQLYYWLILYSDDWSIPYCLPITIATSNAHAPLPMISNNKLIFDQPVEIITASDFEYIVDNNTWSDNKWENTWLSERPHSPMPYNMTFTDKFSDDGVILPANTEYEETLASLAENGRVVIYRGYTSDNEYTAWKTINCCDMASSIPSSAYDVEDINMNAMMSANTITDFLDAVPLEGEIKYADGTVHKEVLIYDFYQNEHDGEYALYESGSSQINDEAISSCTAEARYLNVKNDALNANTSFWMFNPEWDIETCKTAIDAVIDRQNTYLPKSGKIINISATGIDTDIKNLRSAVIDINALLSDNDRQQNNDRQPAVHTDDITTTVTETTEPSIETITSSTTSSTDVLDKQTDNPLSSWVPGDPFYVETDYGIIRFNAKDYVQLLLALQMYDFKEQISIPTDLYDRSYDSRRMTGVVYEVMTQNPWCPYIASLESAGFDGHGNFIIKLHYTTDKVTTEKWRPEIYNAAVAMASEINGTPSLSDEDIYRLINDKLIESASYYTKAAEKCSYTVDIARQTEDIRASWSPYGVLCNKKGVCYSYAQSYKLICDMLNMNCISVSGTISGDNHIWNKVNINDQWYIMDVTNNDHDDPSDVLAKFPHSYCLTSDRLASSLHENDNESDCMDYWYSGEYEYDASDDSLDEWLNNGLLVSLDDIPEHFKTTFTGTPSDAYAVKIDGFDKCEHSDIKTMTESFNKTAVIMGYTTSEFSNYKHYIAGDIFIFAPQPTAS